jgi:hypothetical protein
MKKKNWAPAFAGETEHFGATRGSLSFGGGVLVAFVLGIAGSVGFGALSAVLGTVVALKAVIAGLGLAYVLWLFSRSRERVGRVTLLAVWGVAAAASWAFVPTLALYFAVHVGLLWLVRSLYFYSGVLPAVMDLGLSAFSAGVAVWAAGRSGSPFIAIWCFFLVQALAAAIPPRIRGRAEARSAARPESDAFERARRMAEAAVGRLAARH